MIYNNLIYFLVVILILTSNSPADHPQFGGLAALAIFLVKLALYRDLIGRVFAPTKVAQASAYGTAERQGAILAILCFSLDVYLLDCQYYFRLIPGAKALPVIESLASLTLFASYLLLLWRQAGERYRVIFNSQQTPPAFAWNTLKTNLPIILPWLCLSLFADLLQRLHNPLIRRLMASAWGEEAIFLTFFLCLAIVFPVLVTRMWGCTPMPPGPDRQRIEAFCRRQGMGYAEILLWPLHEGQALTAGVMGIVSRFRYLLITPALLTAMTPEEVDAVIAHEIGHVKRRHLPIFLLLFIGFGLLSQLASLPVLLLLSRSDLFYEMIHLTTNKGGSALALVSTVPMFLLMIVYFRYLVGFFMRNFERQADLYALQTMGESAPLIRVFERIAWLSGDIRDLPSWHHFGLGQRIDCLKRCEHQPEAIKRHDRKVYASLALYVLTLALAAFTLWRVPDDLGTSPPREKFAETVIRQRIGEEPQNPVWRQLLGDLQYSRQRYREAIAEYRAAITLSDEQPEVLNNLAWLLLTVPDPTLFDPAAALPLAKQAMILAPNAHILDTLGLAYWRNGFPEQAILAEQRALAQDPANRDYYTAQIKRFTEDRGQKTDDGGRLGE